MNAHKEAMKQTWDLFAIAVITFAVGFVFTWLSDVASLRDKYGVLDWCATIMWAGSAVISYYAVGEYKRVYKYEKGKQWTK